MDVLAEAIGEVEEAGELQQDEGSVARQAGADPALVQLILRMIDIFVINVHKCYYRVVHLAKDTFLLTLH